MNISVYKHTKDRVGIVRSVGSVVNRILDGGNQLDAKTLEANRLAQGDVNIYRQYKVDNLPACTFAGTFNPSRKKENIENISGLIVTDIDHVDVADILVNLRTHPNVFLAFVSPSGEGIKVVCRVDPIPETDAEHEYALACCWDAFQNLAEEFGFEFDASGKDRSRLCYLAHDPQAIVNTDAAAVTWKRADIPQPQASVAVPLSGSSGSPNDKLKAFVERNNIPVIREREAGGFFVQCPEENLHQSGTGDTDCYVFPNEAGLFALACSHNSCSPSFQKFCDLHGIDNPNKSKRTWNPLKYRTAILEKHNLIKLPSEKSMRRYESGVYSDVQATIIHEVDELLVADNMLRDSRINEVVNLLEKKTTVPVPQSGEYPFLHKDVINLRNGYFHVKTGELEEHHPGIKSTIQLPLSYNAEAKCPGIEGWLNMTFNEQAEIDLAYEIMGVCMLQEIPFPMIIALEGSSHAGKSTFLELIERLIGSENVVPVKLQQLDSMETRFERSGLYGKLAAFDDDASSLKLRGDTIKHLCEGRKTRVEDKGVQGYDMKPFATIIFACNTVPKSFDRTSGWTERLMVVPFRNVHRKERKLNILEPLCTDEEMSGLFNHAYAGLQRVINNMEFSKTEAVLEAEAEYAEGNSFITEYINNELEIVDAETKEYLVRDMFNDFKEYGKEIHGDDFKANMSQRDFGNHVADVTGQRKHSRTRGTSDSRRRIEHFRTLKKRGPSVEGHTEKEDYYDPEVGF